MTGAHAPTVLAARDGAELAYWKTGPDREPATDRALLLVHGAASNHTRWSELVETTHLTERWSVLRPDLRGNGASTLRTRQGIDIWCRDLLEILDAETVDRAVVVGHSLGAQIGLSLAHRAPERVAGLCLLDPVFRSALRGRQGLFARNIWLVRGAAALISGLNRLGLRRRHIPDRDLHRLDEETREAMAAGEALEVIAERYSALGLILAHMPTANYLRQMVATSNEPPPLGEIACPVLVLLSGGISFADIETTRRILAGFPDAETGNLAANHWPLTETPDETREAIEGWLAERFP